jgi:hypothetical protein
MSPPGDRVLDVVYESRFDERARKGKFAVWGEIVRHLQRHIIADRPVLDVACDAGYFIGQVRAVEKWACDIRDVGSQLPADVRFLKADGLGLRAVLPENYFGTLFMSNYLEHLESSHEVIEQLRVAHDLLAPRGRLIVIQPNVRLVGGRYWDFIDHHVALTERSLVEAGELAGLRTRTLVSRFLPYSTKGRLPQDPRLVRLYLNIPIAWRLLGKQTLYVAERPG